MLKKMLPPAVLTLLALTSSGSASAADMAAGCKLKGGTVVQLAAEICALEGGTPVTAAASVVAPAAPAPAASVIAPAPVAASAVNVQAAVESGWSAAQRAVVELLSRPVVEQDSPKRSPENIERTARFDGCRLLVDENMHVDYGNALSARMNLKVSSTVDMRNIGSKAFGLLGKVSSLGGGLKAQAVYFEERKRGSGNNIAISVLEKRDEGYRKYALPGVVAYWDAPRDNLWMLDGYGYPKTNSLNDIATDKIRILFIVNAAEDAAALKKALDDVHAQCRP